MAPMTLHYFDFTGRAECARLLLTLGKVPFEVLLLSRLEATVPELLHGICTECVTPFGVRLTASHQ